jgi:Aspartyl protease
MAAYDSDLFDPPAPLARVNLRAIQTRKIITDVPMLIDSGSDLTLIPEASIAELGANLGSDKRVELQGFDGRVTLARSVELDLIFLGVTFRGRLAVVDSPVGVLGRNVLNRFAIFLDGPHLNWKELSRSTK